MIHPAPKPPKRVKIPKRWQRSRKPMRRVGKRGGAFWKRKNRAFRRALVRERPCELAGRYTTIRLSPNDRRYTTRGLAAILWVHRCWPPLDPAHVEKQAKGAGDVGQCCVLCRPAHRLYDGDADHARWFRVTGLTQKDMENRAGGHGMWWVERGGKANEAA